MKVAVLPVKRLADSLSRLGRLLSPEEREELAKRLFRQALAVLTVVKGIDELIVVSMDREVLDAARDAGVRILEEADQLSHSDSAQRGVAMALDSGAQTVLSAAIDVPLATPIEYEELMEVASFLVPRGLIVVPSLDGTGTNALVRTPPDVIVSAFGPGSFGRHESAGVSAGAEVRAMRPAGIVLDLDSPEDLLAIEGRTTDDNDVLDFLKRIDAFDRARAVIGQAQWTQV